MFSTGPTIDCELKNEIIKELERRPLQMNKYRTNSGDGLSQCFGIVRQRNGTYSGSRQNFTRSHLYDLLVRFGNCILPPDFYYLSIQVNQNYQTKPHKDNGNKGISAIIGFGDYTGGELVIDNTEVDIKDRLVFFDGSVLTHYTKPFTGKRYSIVFHTPDRTFREIPRFSFKDIKGKLCLVESLQGVHRTYNAKGDCIESTDGLEVQRKQRCPTLRACIE